MTYIAKSLLDPSSCKDINTENGVFLIAEAVFQFFDEAQMKRFFLMLADNFPGGKIVFTTMSRSDGFRGWVDVSPPEKREAMNAARSLGYALFYDAPRKAALSGGAEIATSA